MKKRILTTTMALAMAFTTAMSGMGTLTVHAYTDDGAYHGDDRENGGGGSSDWGNLGGSESSGSSSNSSSSDNNGGYTDDGAYHGDGRENGGGGNSDWTTSNNDGGSNSTASAPTGLATKGNTASIPGCETFRQIYKPADGKASIYHKGIEQYTAQLKDADGNAVAYKYASPYKDEMTGMWYLNIVTADGVDTTGYTVGTYKGSVTYLPKLGMNGVMLNQVLVVDATVTAE